MRALPHTETTTAAPSATMPGAWLERAARASHRARALAYGLLGLLALERASGADPAALGAPAPLHAKALFAAAGGTFVALGAWRLLESVLDPERRAGEGARAALLRAGWAASAALQGGLGALAAHAALVGEPGAWAIRALEAPERALGALLGGAFLVLFALSEITRAWTADFSRQLAVTRMSGRARRWASRVGRVGIYARAIALLLAGAALVHGGLGPRPSELEHGVYGALMEVASTPRGAALLSIVGAAALAFAAYQLVLARYRRVRVPRR